MKNKTAFIIHGAYGNPDENWFPWLRDGLEGIGYEVFIPKFPTPDGQTLDNWRRAFRKYEQFINNDTVFIGHSLGPSFILDVLERLDLNVSASFFVAGFVGSLGNAKFDAINKTFVKRKFNWNIIKNNCGKFFVFQSDDDPYVPVEKGEELSRLLDAEFILIKNGGHFNEASGYTRFDLLLKMIKKF